ncbi:MAG: efflux RND transporter periplasmic adaptor subunit [Kiritimatiellae bacterium]|nr:efflux RND transporter periplasmic adaptor subunit [Kiritimatiellia bacterium]
MNASKDKHPVARALGILLPILILTAAVGVSIFLIKTKPKPKTRPPRERSTMVEITTIQTTNLPVKVCAAGTVLPATAISLQPEISGRIIDMAAELEPGGTFKKGDALITIDSRDYAFTQAAREADQKKAEAAYRLELGYQDVAKHEWTLIPDREQATDLDQELAMRKPQLQQAEAARNAAQAALDQAALNMERTTVRAPFNGVVRNRRVNIGAQVTPQTVLAQLAGTDTFWVLITVPTTDLKWIHIPSKRNEKGSKATVHNSRKDTVWHGHVIRRLPDLESAGRMAQILVAIPQPLTAADHPLLLGTYVDVTIEGTMLENIVAIPRSSFREGNIVWLCNKENRLEVRTIKPLWGNRQAVYIQSGLNTGEQLVISDLGTPIAGMKLTFASDSPHSEDQPRGPAIESKESQP